MNWIDEQLRLAFESKNVEYIKKLNQYIFDKQKEIMDGYSNGKEDCLLNN